MNIGFSGALLACAFVGNAVAADVVVRKPPGAAAPQDAAIWIARIEDRYRFKSEGQADGVGARPFDRFIDKLDPERLVFTQADLAAMAGPRAQLDKIDEKQLALPNAVFATYLVRVTAVHAQAQELLRQAPDFTGHERYQRVRARADRAPDDAALRDLWRRKVLDDALTLRLAGVAPEQVAPTLQQRYDRHLQRAQAIRSAEVDALYLNAYIEYVDPHGTYLAPPAARIEPMPAGQAGVGLTLQQKGGYVMVFDMAPDSPAANSATIGPGDRIVGVAQGAGQPMVDVIGAGVEDVVKLLRGAPGSAVVLGIVPHGAARGSAPRRVALTRARVDAGHARGRIELVRRGAATYRIGLVTVPSFYQDFAARKAGAKNYVSVTRDVAAVLGEMKTQNADAILLDMRTNGGGSLTEAVDLAGLFLPGAAVAQQREPKQVVKVEKAPEGAPAWDRPLAILIDRGAAAATEIVAAALQDHGRALVIGDASYGRSSVQTILDLNRFNHDPAKDFGQLKLTIAAVCRAGGAPIQRAGVTPDLVAPGRIDVTGKANGGLFAGVACQPLDVPKRAGLAAVLPTLAGRQASRMQANRPYQAHLAQRARDEAALASDEVSLNEAERRGQPDAGPPGDIASLQLAEALQVVGDAVELLGKPAQP